MEIPSASVTIASLIDAAMEKNQGGTRSHLGCSVIGHHCDRWLWLSFRWAVIEKFSGRTLRIFRRGQNEEATVIADLVSAGMIIDGQQARVTLAPHFSGSIDGCVAGVPEAPKKPHILEIKTTNTKRFSDLEKNSVEKSCPTHYAQMQCYMHGTGIDRALYVAINKDDDHIYTERVRYSKEVAQALIERAVRIIKADRMPEPCSADPSWYQCKMCAGHDLCFGSKKTKEVNCRTCAHSTATDDGKWVCERWMDNIPTEHQKAGCDSHVLHPDLVPWPRKESQGIEGIYIIGGVPVRNGAPDAFCMSSREILSYSPSEMEKRAVEIFGGEVAGVKSLSAEDA